MKKVLLSMAAVGAIAVAAPSMAQYGTANVNAGGGMGIENRIARLDARINAGVQAGTIDRTEARTLRLQLRDIRQRERQYSRNGLSQQERADLQQRVRNFRDQLRLADGGRTDRYGSNWNDDGYYGQGGPYEAVDCDNNNGSGLGGIIDSIFGGGGNDNCVTGLRVGQRVTGNLGAVPWQYRNQFRDGGGVYYRSDGRAVYQIDARTHTVLRIYDMD